jgi:hypothetical protein
LKRLILVGILFSIVFLSTAVLAQEESGLKTHLTKLKEMGRSFITKILGEERSGKLLGPAPEEVVLPAIPQINKNAKSTDVYQNQDLHQAPASEQERQSNYRFLEEVYQAVRGGNPAPQEVQKWRNVLDQGGSREGIYHSLVLDDNYAGLENFTKPINDKMIDFTENFLSRFLSQKIDRKFLTQANFYNLKRQVVEKTLEMADTLSLSKDKKPMADWYGVMSGELAEKYASVFQNDMRKNTSKKRHRDWALKVPFQQVKSEIIIKLHTIYNSL